MKKPDVQNRLTDEQLWSNINDRTLQNGEELDPEVDSATGDLVEEYIKRRFQEQPSNLSYDSETKRLNLIDSEGNQVGDSIVVTADKTEYSLDVSILELRVNNRTYTGSGSVIANATSVNAQLKLNIEATGMVAGTEFVDNQTKLILIGLCESPLSEEFDRSFSVLELRRNPGIVLIDISQYLKSNSAVNIDGKYIRVVVSRIGEDITASAVSATSLTVKELRIAFKANSYRTTVNKIEFEVSDTSGYLCYKLNDQDFAYKPASEGITLQSGPNNICVRLLNNNNDNPELFSEWINVSVLYLNDTTPLSAIITNIPKRISNCDSPALFTLTTTKGKAGNIQIVAFKSSNEEEISRITKTNYTLYLGTDVEFKNETVTLIGTEEVCDYPYYTYVELEEITNQNNTVFLKFYIIIDGEVLEVYLFEGTDNNAYSNNGVYLATINQSSFNERKELLYVKSPQPIINYSQINKGSLFDNVTPDLDSSDGFLQDGRYTSFRVSPINELFTEPIALKDSTGAVYLPNRDEFTIELLLKTTNITDYNKEIMSIGDIRIFPSYLRVHGEGLVIKGGQEDVACTYIASRADWNADEVTHIMITYNSSYKPNTYDYDFLYPNYNANAKSFGCLKIYINGTISRVKQMDKNTLLKDGKFDLSIHPSDATINLYAFRTYDKCFNYSEIKKNRLSAFIDNKSKIDYFRNNYITYEELDYSADKLVELRNKNIFGTISIEKCLGTFDSRLYGQICTPKNVILMVLQENESDPENKSNFANRPLYYLNRSGSKDATMLIKYAIPENVSDEVKQNYINACGRLRGAAVVGDPNYDEYYKALGSSAKKYGGAHNIQFSKFLYKADNSDEEVGYYVMPSDPSIHVEKTCGKVNYASSMQSHKLGACKLYHEAYANMKGNNLESINNGRKAVLEDEFFYFYININDCLNDATLSTVTWDDIDFEKVKFFGFLTWGSAKGDKPTSGYKKNVTKEYIVFEGADNKNPCTNFKVPWAAQQMWKPSSVENLFDYYKDYSLDKFEQQSGWDEVNNKPDYLTGIYIWDETIQYRVKKTNDETKDSDEKNPDSWDLAFALGDELKNSDNKKTGCYTFKYPEAKITFNLFAEFYNYIYLFDFSSLKICNSEVTDLDVNKKYVLTTTNSPIITDNNINNVEVGDIIRWDYINRKWVHAGLYHKSNTWDKLNIVDLYNDLKAVVNQSSSAKEEYSKLLISDELLQLTSGSFANFGTNVEKRANSIEGNWNTILRALSEFFKFAVKYYTDYEDIAYHEAFIRLVLGTDNKAKNTYWLIIGKKYDKTTGEITNDGDRKIRLYLDDLDTIFATDNNGQLVKPYYLVETPFNTDFSVYWGDADSGFFYNFDIVFNDVISRQLREIIDFALGTTKNILDKSSKIYLYFLSVYDNFPSIAYNHTSELWYEVMQTLYLSGRKTAFGTLVFGESSIFGNNLVEDPVSLSHGSCRESEVGFLNDRLFMLSTYSHTGTTTYGEPSKLTGTTGGSLEVNVDMDLSNLTYIKYHYPETISKPSITEFNPDPILTISDNINRYTDLSKDPYIWDLVSDNYNNIYSYHFNRVAGLTGGQTWNNTELFRTIRIDRGSRFINIPNFKNASDIKIVSTDDDLLTIPNSEGIIDMSQYFKNVEYLDLTKAIFPQDKIIDFSKCTRLKTLKLSRAEGINNIYLPRNNKLEVVELPNTINSINIGLYPNLQSITFDSGVLLNDVYMDCRNSNTILFLKDYLNPNAEKVELINCDGLVIDEEFANVLTSVSNIKLDSGTIYIKDGENKAAISLQTKQNLVEKFGDIDGTTSHPSKTLFDYLKVNITSISSDKFKAIHSTGKVNFNITTNPNNANNVGITNDGHLDIRYTSGNVNLLRINETTGEVIEINGTGKTYVDITISGFTTRCQIQVGFVPPQRGDFAYADGHFSSEFEGEELWIGNVFYCKQRGSDNKYDIRIISNSELDFGTKLDGPMIANSIAGPCFKKMYDNLNRKNVYYEITGSDWNSLQAASLIENNLAYANAYVVHPRNYSSITNLKIRNSLINVNATNLVYSNDLLDEDIDCGKDCMMSHIEQVRINSRNSNYSTDLSSYRTFNTSLLNITNNNKRIELLYPLFVYVYLFEPKITDQSKLDLTIYGKGNWYIASGDELELLIYDRIYSQCKPNGAADNTDKWNTSNYVNNDGTFSKIALSSATNIPFMRSDKTCYCCDSAVLSGNNPVYGVMLFYNGNSSLGGDSGWNGRIFSQYYDNGDKDAHFALAGFKYNIPICCQVII